MRQSRPNMLVRPMSISMPMPPLRLVRDPLDEVLPPCPVIQDGIAVKYMGTERRRVEGEVTGYVYHADPMRRQIEVDRRDLLAVLSLRAFVLAD